MIAENSMLVIVCVCPEDCLSLAVAIEKIVGKPVEDRSAGHTKIIEIVGGVPNDLLPLRERGYEVDEVPF
ncbi:MAG: hypothetical protein P4L63_02935 [Candidatus Pacebacteria bacterium]|nr:hypothetical protein [Candidatus Paceibacterota bacterium]